MKLTARILSQGDEIVTGATLDTNAHWLAGRLHARGVEVRGMASAGDDLKALVALFRHAGSDCDLIVSTGGLGPTRDDLSAEAAAEAAGVELYQDAAALAQVEARFRKIDRPMPAVNVKQAVLPRGATVLVNPEGTAPGFALDLGRARAFFFPGVPRELKTMVPMHLDPWLQAHGLAASLVRRFHVCGVGESVLQQRLGDLAPPPSVRIGYKTWGPYNSVVVYGEGAAGDDFARVADAVRERLGADVHGLDDETLPEVLGRLLAARNLTVGVAESCTAGLVLALLTTVPGSSAWVQGGVVAYANEVKRDVLGVPGQVLETEGAVSETCALAMAEGVRRMTGAGVGLSVTGIAGPGGGSEAKPVGLVCFGLADAGGTRVRTVRFGDRGRDVVRDLAAAHLLEWLRRHLLDVGT